jgi:polyribonucleotide nucleotidyltransferase
MIVKCINITEEGKIDLSRRDAMIELDGMTPENEIDDVPGKPRRNNNRGPRKPRRD